ncbi:ras-related protein Rab-23 isoform X1 [Oryctolagus cuniculus]|uniref:ras-related protein Rab-23 isoform X1 n=2 Tax=Oryctolagus cuniculus TaxID=9986 RepID=UPI002230DE85|nr:ras-related protein Rab-23 isoform X2 [Oryctolagus cuniculus]
MLEEDLEVAIKMVVVGNGAVGKSSMIQRYCKGIFTKDYKKTIGVDFLERQIQVNDEDVRLMLWDTAGQEEFDAITKAYYRGAQACVLVFSTTDRESFEAISSWREKVVAEVGDIPTVLVQNKIDLLDDSCIKNEEAEALAKRLKLRFYRTSVKEDLNVNEVFKYLAEKYLQKLKQQITEDPEVMHSSSNKIGRDRERRGERDIFRLLVHSPNGYNGWGWARLKPEPEASSGSPMWVQGPRQYLGHLPLLSQVH